MSEPALEVAGVFNSLGPEFFNNQGRLLSGEQRRVLRDLTLCRTAALGGHVKRCDRCGHGEIAYNSCRNRHCPKCQAAARAEWLEARSEDLLPVEYFHVVFTPPEQLGAVALQNKRLIYGLLFRAASETLVQIAADQRHLGAEIGLLAVLHTWGQTLQHHPHLHCVVPGGGLSPDHTKWVACRPGFFLPVRVLGRLFRGKFVCYLRQSHEHLVFAGQTSSLADPKLFAKFLRQLMKTEWNVYAKPPFGGPQQVLKYLARYTHRVAISNQRLVSLADGRVSFTWKDYAADGVKKTMTLEAAEFTRRFLLHVLPKGFVRIRHYGFLANRRRRQKVELCRRLLEQVNAQQILDKGATEIGNKSGPEDDALLCPECRQGKMVIVEKIESFIGETLSQTILILAANTS